MQAMKKKATPRKHSNVLMHIAGSRIVSVAAVQMGKDVAVKVLRPGVRRKVESDIRTAGSILVFLNHVFDSHYLRGLWSVFLEFRRIIREEMSFRKEKENCERFRKNLAYNPNIIIPEVIIELCTNKVFVLEYHSGIRADDTEGLKKLKIAPSALVSSLIDIYARQILFDGFLHADPHPGNILINEEGKIIIVDFGMALEIDFETSREILKIIVAAVRGNVNTIVTGFYKLRLVDPGVNVSQMRDAAEKLITVQLTTDYGMRKVMEIAEDILKTFYMFPLRMPTSLVYLFRAGALIEGIGISFDPGFNSLRAAMPVYKKIALEVYIEPEKSIKDKVLDGLADVVLFTENLFNVMNKAEREELTIRMHPADIMEMEKFMRSVLLRTLLTIFAAGLAVFSAILYIATDSELILGAGILISIVIFLPLLVLPLKSRIK